MEPDPYLPGHGDRSYGVDHYDLDLDYVVSTNQLRGRATLRVTAAEDLERLTLDLHRLRVEKVTVDGDQVTYRHRSGRLLVSHRLADGESAEVVVRYRGKPALVRDEAGEAGWEELTDGAIVAAQPGGAPSWFPCNDRPDDKATYRIAVSAPADYTVVANGERTQSRRQGASTSWVYEQDRPISTYLACVNVGRYVEVDQDADVPISGVVPSDRRDDFADAFSDQPAMMALFTELFGSYPFGCYRAVVTADDLEIPLEAGGLSTFGANFLSRDHDVQRLIAHELSHQWFGNSVTARTWKDIWLHEGFACYSEWLWSERSGGEDADHWARHHHARLADLPQDLLLGDPGPADMFDDRVYKRGALTLHALRRHLGDDAFFAMVRTWVGDHAHGVVETSDLRALVERTGGVEAAGLLDAWVNELSLPPLS